MDTEITKAHLIEPSRSNPTVNWTGIVLFIVLAFGISWATWLGLRALEVPFVIRTASGMFGPALAALLVRLIRREGFADAGLKLVGRGRTGAARMYLAAYFVPPILIAVGIGLALLIGIQHWAFSENLQGSAHAIVNALARQGRALPPGYSAEQLALINVLASTALAFTLGLLFNMIFTFGEEFGWRGYLLPSVASMRQSSPASSGGCGMPLSFSLMAITIPVIPGWASA